MNNNFWVTSYAICQKHWQIASQVTEKLLFMVTNVLFHFLYPILCPEHIIPLKTIILIADLAIVA